MVILRKQASVREGKDNMLFKAPTADVVGDVTKLSTARFDGGAKKVTSMKP